MNDTVKVRRIGRDEATAYIDALADLLIECVDSGATVSFMRPLARDKALAFWRGVAADTARGERALLVAEDGEGRLLGTVQLVMQVADNQAHRADVVKMLVHRSARRRGIAHRLMAALDDVARDERRSVLVLDTLTGGDAERLYQRTGWQRVGEVPKYALSPDGGFSGATFFYKHL